MTDGAKTLQEISIVDQNKVYALYSGRAVPIQDQDVKG